MFIVAASRRSADQTICSNVPPSTSEGTDLPQTDTFTARVRQPTCDTWTSEWIPLAPLLSPLPTHHVGHPRLGEKATMMMADGVDGAASGVGASLSAIRVRELAKCAWCDQVLRDPVVVPCSSGHCVCATCRDEAVCRGDTACRGCREEVDLRACKASSVGVRQALGLVEAECPHASEGCSFRGPSCDLTAHVATSCRFGSSRAAQESRNARLLADQVERSRSGVESIVAGGETFWVSRSVLRKERDSLLGHLFCEEEGGAGAVLNRSPSGAVVLECDGGAFGSLVAHLDG